MPDMDALKDAAIEHMQWYEMVEKTMLDLISFTSGMHPDEATFILVTMISQLLQPKTELGSATGNLVSECGMIWLKRLIPLGHPADRPGKMDVERLFTAK